MTEIKVNASKDYSVYIGSGLLQQLGAYIGKIAHNCTVAVVSDSNVWPIYGDLVHRILLETGYRVVSYVFPAGEASKSGATYLNILQFLAENHITRSDLLLALGGGVVGDIAGFSAATYLRGIRYIQVPTTLLAMVDSSVGGKTAIDLDVGKNLAGAFYQPSLVLADTNVLKTLPADVFQDGCAEVIKYSVLYDTKLFSHLMDKGPMFDQEAVIAKCVSLKRDIVSQDEFDTGERQKLNLGHTIGHGVEAHSNYTISHGKAVAIGMAIIARACCNYKICPQQDCEGIIAVLDRFSLPVSCAYSAEQLYHSSLSDKKRSGGSVNLILPRQIGDCIIQPTDISKLESFIKAGL